MFCSYALKIESPHLTIKQNAMQQIFILHIYLISPVGLLDSFHINLNIKLLLKGRITTKIL